MTTTTYTSRRLQRRAFPWRSITRQLAGLGLSLAALAQTNSAQADQIAAAAPASSATSQPTAQLASPSPLPMPPAQTAPLQVSAPQQLAQPGPAMQPGPTALPPGDRIAESKPNARRRAGLVPVLRLGFIVAGAGQVREECEGDLCASSSAATTEFTDASGPAMIGGDLMFHIGPDFRLGPGALFLPKTSWDIDGSSTDFEAGSELAVLLVGEGVFDLSRAVSLSLRGFLGADLLFPGGDLKSSVEDRTLGAGNGSVQCGDFNRLDGASCRRGKHPFAGPTYGGGVGLLIPSGSVALRVELMFQAYDVQYTIFDVSIDGAGEGSFQGTISGTRSLLAAGMEF